LVSIGDVSGKGVPAAILMAAVQASLRALALSCGNGISDVVGDLNRMVWDLSPDNFYATMFCARIDATRQELHFVNAGHDRALLLRQKDVKRVVKLQCTGTVLGLSANTEFEQRKLHVEPGDVLVAVTDGIIDAEGPDGQALDEQAVINAVRECPAGSSIDLVRRIMCAVGKLTKGLAPTDDRTIAIVRFLATEPGAFIERPGIDRAFAYAMAS
jgi:sigma-B regulation protein RsbU (phosphoserine phosphatase)